MREFDDKTTWEGGRDDCVFLLAVLEAAGAHEKQRKAIAVHVERWNAIEVARRASEDGIARANAGVSWCDHLLDTTVRKLADESEHESRSTGDGAFARYFPEPPSEVIRMGLEAEIERCAEFEVVAKAIPQSKTLAEKHEAVRKAMEAGRGAIERRRAAYTASAQSSLDIAIWKEAANATRVSIFVQLQAWGLEHGMDRSYADRFFPAKSAGKSKAKKPAPPTPPNPVTPQ